MHSYKHKFILISLFFNLFFTPLLVQAQPKPAVSNATKIFLKAESELKSGVNKNFSLYQNQLRDYPLYPYLEYIYLSNTITTASADSINNFSHSYADFPHLERLRTTWLLQAAKQKNWTNFLQVYKPTTNTLLQCNYIEAQLNTQPAAAHANILAQAAPLWLVGTSQPEICDALFAKWEAAGLMTKTMLWKRIQLAIEQNNFSLANYLAKKLALPEQNIVNLWIDTSLNPHLVQNIKKYAINHPALSEALISGISKVAINDPELATKLWKYYSVRHTFSERHWALVASAVGLSLVDKNDPRAVKWLNKIPNKYRNEKINNINLRLILKQNDWKNLINLTSNIHGKDVEIDKWRYWHARTLEMLNLRSESQQLYHLIAKDRNYYGFLASARILKTFNLNYKKPALTSEKLHKTLSTPAVLRTHAWIKLGRMSQANQEWLHALKFFNEEQKQAAAKLAQSWKLPYFSILALANAQGKDDLDVRFPRPYSHHVAKAAKQNAIDPAWIYAVTRQESAFVHTAKSSAGALGLMQLKPSTAKMWADHFRDPFTVQDLFNPGINIKYGCKHLRAMLNEHFENTVLATASHNAGSKRVKSWLPEYDTPADMWIETIPYFETRNYVKNVLTYTIIYQQLLGKKPELRSKMPIIAGKKTT